MPASEHSCHNTMWHTTHSSATRRQQSEIQYKPLRGSGTRGAILHVSRATFVWRTFHTQFNNRWKIVILQPRWYSFNLEHLTSLQSEDYTQLNVGWTRSRPQGSIPQLHEGAWRNKSQRSVNFQEGMRHVTIYHTNQSPRKQVPEQRLELCSMEVTRLQ